MKNILKEYPKSALLGAGLLLPPLAAVALGQVRAELVSHSNPNDGTQTQAETTINYYNSLALKIAGIEGIFLSAGMIGLVQRRSNDSRQYRYSPTKASAVSMNLNSGNTSFSISDDHANQRGIGHIDSY